MSSCAGSVAVYRQGSWLLPTGADQSGPAWTLVGHWTLVEPFGEEFYYISTWELSIEYSTFFLALIRDLAGLVAELCGICC